VKVLQAPPPPPPGANTTSQNGGPGVPPVSAQDLYTSALRDYTGGHLDLAINEYQDFLQRFPDDPNAPGAQLNIGQARMLQGKYEQAAKDFDAVLERYPDNGSVTLDAWFQKGMALKDGGHSADARKVWQELVRKSPGTDEAKEAQEQIRALGPAAPAAARKK
jgi:TolA-binding protein